MTRRTASARPVHERKAFIIVPAQSDPDALVGRPVLTPDKRARGEVTQRRVGKVRAYVGRVPNVGDKYEITSRRVNGSVTIEGMEA